MTDAGAFVTVAVRGALNRHRTALLTVVARRTNRASIRVSCAEASRLAYSWRDLSLEAIISIWARCALVSVA